MLFSIMAYHRIANVVPCVIGEGNGNPLQCSCLENPMNRGTWWAIVHGVARLKHDLATKPLPPSLSYTVGPYWQN